MVYLNRFWFYGVHQPTELTLVDDASLAEQALHVGHPLIKVRQVVLPPFQKVRAEPVVHLLLAVSQQHADTPKLSNSAAMLEGVVAFRLFLFLVAAKSPFAHCYCTAQRSLRTLALEWRENLIPIPGEMVRNRGFSHPVKRQTGTC